MLCFALVLALAVTYCHAQICADTNTAQQSIIGGRIINYAACGVRYAVTSYGKADLLCRKNGGRLATPAELSEALSYGYGICNCGWLDDGSAKYPVNGVSGCGVSNTIVTCPANAMGVWGGGPGWNVFCFTAWSDWSGFGGCSEASCQGLQFGSRTCHSSSVEGDANCPGVSYKLQTCNVGVPCANENTAELNRAQAVCDLVIDDVATMALTKTRKIGRCSDLCNAITGKTCRKAVQIYGNPERRYSRAETQVHEYPSCNTIYSNTCCCQDIPPPTDAPVSPGS